MVAGCTFDHGFEEQGAVDDPMGTDAGTGSGSGSSTGLTCKYPDGALRLCVEFDKGANGADSSGYHMDANANNLGASTRASDPAAAVYWNSDLDVAENNMLDISGAITFESWIYVTADQGQEITDNRSRFTTDVSVRTFRSLPARGAQRRKAERQPTFGFERPCCSGG